MAEETANERDDSDELIPFWQRMVMFLQYHNRGVIAVLTPLLFISMVHPWPGEKYQWCAFCLCVMAVYWVTECVPLPVTSFLPVVVFPLTGVMSAMKTCQCYINDTVFVFLGSLILASAVEQSGLHKRLALGVIRMIGYSHYKLLFAMSFVTMFVSMWVTNTAAATMMVPINFALLKVFEDQNLMLVFERTEDGETASDITTCYFCSATFSATIGGIGTLVGTGTNLVFKGLLEKQYPNAPEYLTFPLFSAFAVPYMLVMELLMYLCMIIKYFGFLRPKSKEAKAAVIPQSAKEATKEAVERDLAALGPITFWEYMVIILFGSAILLFFCRSPRMFPGWGDAIIDYFNESIRKYIRDSSLAIGVCFLMLLLPASLRIFDNCRAKKYGDLPRGRIRSVLDWNIMNNTLPYSFMFLLGGGFALSTAALKENSDLNGKIGELLSVMEALPGPLVLLLIIIFTVFITNFASNVAVANVVVPIGMTLKTQVNSLRIAEDKWQSLCVKATPNPLDRGFSRILEESLLVAFLAMAILTKYLAEKIGGNPLLYNIACGYSASYCFCVPVGTPGNLVVQSAANIVTKKMIIAGAGPTVLIILTTWLALLFWAPVIWPDLRNDIADLPWLQS